MPLDPAKTLRKRFGIAVLAAGANFRAAADWIPGGVGPFDFGVHTHFFSFFRFGKVTRTWSAKVTSPFRVGPSRADGATWSWGERPRGSRRGVSALGEKPRRLSPATAGVRFEADD